MYVAPAARGRGWRGRCWPRLEASAAARRGGGGHPGDRHRAARGDRALRVGGLRAGAEVRLLRATPTCPAASASAYPRGRRAGRSREAPSMTRTARILATALLALVVVLTAAPPGSADRDRGLRGLPAAGALQPRGQARHEGTGPLAGPPRRRRRADVAQLQERRHLGAQGGPGVRLDARRRPPQGPGPGAGSSSASPSPRTSTATRTPRPVGWASCTSSGTTTCTPRGTSSTRTAYLSSSCKQPEEVLEDAASPRPHAHLALAGPAARAAPAGTTAASPD